MSTKDEIFLPDVGWLHEADFLELAELAYEPVKQNIVSEAEYQERTARWRVKQTDEAE